MTSPVDTSVKFFHSKMSGAPTINGTPGAIIAMLDACLKDGFDTKTLVSLIAASGVMTATYTGTHSGERDAVVLIDGVTGGPTGYAGANGEQKVTGKPSSTTLTWATALPDGTYTGTITMKMAPLGWLKPFSGTNRAVYKSADPMGTGFCLDVQDTGTQYAIVRGYEQMSGVGVGVAPFPTVAQRTAPSWVKSGAANSAVNLWFLIGDSRAFYYAVAPNSYASATFVGMVVRGFGDMASLRPGGDAWNCMLNSAPDNSSADLYDTTGDLSGYGSNTTNNAFPRAVTGLGTSQLHNRQAYTANINYMSGADPTLGPSPSAIDGSVRFSKIYMAKNAGEPPRCDVPGIFYIPQTSVFDIFKFPDTYAASGSLAGHRLIFLTTGGSNIQGAAVASQNGALAFDITGPWR